MKKIINKKNLLFFIPLILIMIISFFTMYKAKYVLSIYNNHLLKQVIWYVIGFSVLFFFKKIKPLFKYSFILYLFNIFLLILVLFFGKEVNGSRAWFDFKFFSFQPSELMKLTYSLYLANILSKYKHVNYKKEFIFLLKILIIFLIPSILIFLEPDTGAIIFLLIITIFMIYFSKVKKIWFLCIFLLMAIIISSFFYLYYFNQDLLINLIGTSFFYRMDRIINFGPNNNMQLENSLISIATGNMFGTSIRDVSIYIPESATDFAFALSTNTFGFIGSIILLICYFVMDIYFLIIINTNRNKTTKIFTSGFIGMFIFNQIQNISMNIGLLPIMGIPLPFLSYGGSTILVYFLFITIIFYLDSNKV